MKKLTEFFPLQPDPQANNLINALCYELKTAAAAHVNKLNGGRNQDDSNNNSVGEAKNINDYDIGDYKTFRREMSKYDLKQAVFSQGTLVITRYVRICLKKY